MRNRVKLSVALCVLLSLLVFIPSSDSQNQPKTSPAPGQQNQVKDTSPDKSKVVYVCACLKTKSCSCMTEAKMEGPCACGTEGGPPLKAVPKDSEWAKENRETLAK
jgi:hypothetical protein